MPHESTPNQLAVPDPLRDWYRDTIWARRLNDDDALFEVMSLQVFQAGLTWKMVLDNATPSAAPSGTGRSTVWPIWAPTTWRPCGKTRPSSATA